MDFHLFETDTWGISHIVTVCVVGGLVVCGTASLIYRYLKSPIDTIVQNGKVHRVVKSSWLYYWLYRLIEFLSCNFKTMASIGLRNDNQIGILFNTFIKICATGVFGNKIKTYANDVYKVENEVKPELQKDIPEVEKVLDKIEKDLPPPATTVSVKGKATAAETPHTQIPHQLTPAKVEATVQPVEKTKK